MMHAKKHRNEMENCVTLFFSAGFGHRLFLPALLILCMAGASHGIGPVTAPQDPESAGLTWTIETVAGDSLTAASLKLTDGEVTVGEPAERTLPLAEIISIETGRQPDPQSPSGPQWLKFTTGGQLNAVVKSISSESVAFSASGIDQSLGLESIAAIVWTDSIQLKQLLAAPTDESDRVVVQGNEGSAVVEGIFESLDEFRLSIQFQGQSRTMARDRVQAIVPARIGQPTGDQNPATLTLTDGSTVAGQLESLDAGVLRMTLPGGMLEFPVKSVVSIQLASDRVQRLADLQPLDSATSVQFAPDRGWRKNLSVEGNPISLLVGDRNVARKFRNGIGMQSTSRIAFSNKGDFDRLRGWVGIDTETAGRGDCIVVVRGDGIQLWSERLRGGQPAVPVDVDISGMQVVELAVQAGEQFDLADHVSWADIRMIRTR